VEIISFTESIEILATIGFVFLLFLVGLEIDFNQLEYRGIKPILMGLGIFSITIVLSSICIYLMKLDFFIAIILSATSVDVVMRTLREMGKSKGKHGQDMIIAALVADFSAVVLITIYVAYHSALIQADPDPSKIWAILFIPILFILFYSAYQIIDHLMWHYPDTIDKFFKSDDPSEMGVRASFALLLIFVGLSYFVGIEAILGAFLAGAMMSLLFRDIAGLEKKLYSIGYGFLIPIFFISIGVKFDFEVFRDFDALILIPVFIGIAFIIKILPTLFFFKDYSVKNRLSSGLLLSAHLSILLAGTAIGIELGVIDTMLESSMIIVVIVTCILGPILFQYLMKAKG
ncbi:MAG: cation:proton antiporter, partial [Thermoplasmata archaeon]|nr:cation:proton antiporter [Thermoplasmata archaeon]